MLRPFPTRTIRERTFLVFERPSIVGLCEGDQCFYRLERNVCSRVNIVLVLAAAETERMRARKQTESMIHLHAGDEEQLLTSSALCLAGS